MTPDKAKACPAASSAEPNTADDDRDADARSLASSNAGPHIDTDDFPDLSDSDFPPPTWHSSYDESEGDEGEGDEGDESEGHDGDDDAHGVPMPVAKRPRA